MSFSSIYISSACVVSKRALTIFGVSSLTNQISDLFQRALASNAKTSVDQNVFMQDSEGCNDTHFNNVVEYKVQIIAEKST